MRQVVLDTETTGLEPAQGHRIIEIGCVELVNRRLTAHRFHHYLQPDRESDAGALEVHGITTEFLRDKPRFADIVEEFLEFVADAEVIIHNAPFDVGFLDCELGLLPGNPGRLEDRCRVLDTLALARDLHPGQKHSLDALCRRYGIDNSQRELHGALLDAEILADVYLAMTGGQATLDLNVAEQVHAAAGQSAVTGFSHAPRPVVHATEEELAAHARRLAAIEEASDGRCVWMRLDD